MFLLLLPANPYRRFRTPSGSFGVGCGENYSPRSVYKHIDSDHVLPSCEPYTIACWIFSDVATHNCHYSFSSVIQYIHVYTARTYTYVHSQGVVFFTPPSVYIYIYIYIYVISICPGPHV